MNRRFIIFILFCIVAALQLYAPASLILQQEDVLENGKAYKFKLEPVDPEDAFRGRYMHLNYESNTAPLNKDGDIYPNQKIYAVLEIDSDGYAYFNKVHLSEPDIPGSEYIELECDYYRRDQSTIHLKLPFDRYYLNEKKASLADEVYRESVNSEKHKTHAVVRVKDGHAVLEEVYIDNTPILEYLKKH